jgi:hypothetical protein
MNGSRPGDPTCSTPAHFAFPSQSNVRGRPSDCSSIESERNKPLCQAPDGRYGTTQYHAQAYPGLRQLELLSKLGESAVAASICPRNVDEPGREDYAYDPAVQAMIDWLKHTIE